MDMRRLRAGELIASTGGVVLLVSLFLPWYRPESSAWQAFSANDLILALVALAAVALAFVTAWQRVPAVPIAMDSLVTLLGLIGLVLVLVRIAWLPGLASDRAYGLWLGLAGSLAIVAGGWIAMRDQRPSSAGSWTDSAGRPTAGPPEIAIRTLAAPKGQE